MEAKETFLDESISIMKVKYHRASFPMKKAMRLQNLSSLYLLLSYFTLYFCICLLMNDGSTFRGIYMNMFNSIVMKVLQKEGIICILVGGFYLNQSENVTKADSKRGLPWLSRG